MTYQNLFFNNSVFATDSNTDFNSIGNIRIKKVGVVFLFNDLFQRFVGKNVKICLFVSGEFELIDKVGYRFYSWYQYNIKAAKAERSVGSNLITIAEYGAQSQHHAVIEAFVCNVQ